MEDEYIVEEGSQGGSQRPFLLAVGVLLTILVLAVVCSAVLLSSRGTDTNGQQATSVAIQTQNAIVAVTNAAVTQTIAAMETEAAQPTHTPEPPTATATVAETPTEALLPTETPVVAKATEKVPATATNTPEGSTVVQEDTPTAVAVASETGNEDTSGTSSSTTSTSSSEGDSLPQTGVETWGILVTAVALVFILVVARRLRNS